MKRITLAVCMVALLVVTPAALARHHGPLIYPRHSHPHGLSFEQWQAVSLRHAFGVAFSRQQLLDVGQASCGSEVEPREAWLLPAAAGGWHTTRCRVPAHHPLVLPITGVFAVTAVDKVRATPTAAKAQLLQLTSVRLRIDGRLVQNRRRFIGVTRVFSFRVPKDNIWGVAAQRTTAAGAAYLVVLRLPVGHHTLITYGANAATGFQAGEVIHLTVA